MRVNVLVVAGMLAAPCASAAPGDILFLEDFEGNLNSWTVSASPNSADGDSVTMAGASKRESVVMIETAQRVTFVRGPVTVTSAAANRKPVTAATNVMTNAKRH